MFSQQWHLCSNIKFINIIWTDGQFISWVCFKQFWWITKLHNNWVKIVADTFTVAQYWTINNVKYNIFIL